MVELQAMIDDKSHIAYIIKKLKERRGTILVVKHHLDDIVDIVLKEIDLDDSGYIFFASELEIDPINNCMVPTHRLATPDELQYLENKTIQTHKLPVLRMLDPIRRWHNFSRGSVVAIERTLDNVYFRVVK